MPWCSVPQITMGFHQPDDVPGGVLVLDVAPATPSSSALLDDAPDLPDNVTLFTRHYTSEDSHPLQPEIRVIQFLQRG